MTAHDPCPKCHQPHLTPHGHPSCTGHSKRRHGGPCTNPRVTGLDVCRSHGGASPQSRAKAARARETQAAERAVATLGLAVDISPTEALLEEVRWTAGHVQWLRGKVQELDEARHLADHAEEDDDAEIESAIGDGRHALVWGTTKVKSGGDDAGTTQEAKPSIWYALYAAERAHLVTVCAAAIKAGVEERRVRLAEQQGDLVATVIRRILDALNLTPTQLEQVPVVVPRELRAITGGAA
ncbi:hypothetical protein OEB99_16625 [Actinotalea sp. M2MS4P-6]|uniref:hypothetical protein n=1 Tax=Actinotalea sp. M2MS4P-6 TaxID=2983762 RepID=UPI0021E4F914|nr:hypothetical protein [Actinotalea sp. M2MS4P-6]MCV2395942.1 hypothetical protein [Actinotalea sp. M2MS4P-6]